MKFKVQVYEIAKELGITSTKAVQILKEAGFELNSHLKVMDDDMMQVLAPELLVKYKSLDTTDMEKVEEAEKRAERDAEISNEEGELEAAAEWAWDFCEHLEKGSVCPMCALEFGYGTIDEDKQILMDHMIKKHPVKLVLAYTNPTLGFDAYHAIIKQKQLDEESVALAEEGFSVDENLDSFDYLWVDPEYKRKIEATGASKAAVAAVAAAGGSLTVTAAAAAEAAPE